jgi:GntR family transcriptional regulator
VALDLHVDTGSPIPIRRQLTEQLKHAIDAGSVPREQALPSIRELAGFLAINPNTVARVVEDLKRSGYVEARRGRGIFVTARPPARPLPHRRERLLQDVVMRAAALGMTADDVAVGVLSVAATRATALHQAVEVLLVECSTAELEFFARELEGHLPVSVEKVLLADLPAVVRRQKAPRWPAAVTSFSHLPEVERLLSGRGVPVIALLAEAHLETLHKLAQLAPGTRLGIVSETAETAHSLEHSIANAGLPNIALAGVCPVDGAALGRLVRRVDVIICSTAAAERVRAAGSAVQMIVDDRALNPHAVEMLADVLVRDHRGRPAASPAVSSRTRLPASDGRKRSGALTASARRRSRGAHQG